VERGWSKGRPSTAADASGRCSRENRAETVAHQSDTDCLVLDPLEGRQTKHLPCFCQISSFLSSSTFHFMRRPSLPKWPPSAASTVRKCRTFPAYPRDVTIATIGRGVDDAVSVLCKRLPPCGSTASDSARPSDGPT
jgi:hypothetical protein